MLYPCRIYVFVFRFCLGVAKRLPHKKSACERAVNYGMEKNSKIRYVGGKEGRKEEVGGLQKRIKFLNLWGV